MKSGLTDLELMIHHETEKAILVSNDGNRDAAQWLPKSRVQLEEPITIGKAQIVTLPQRLAEEKGLA